MLRQPSRGSRDGVFCYGLISPATDLPAPVRCPSHGSTLTSAASLACGKGHCCLIESGRALCWGNSDWLQTGSDSDLPVSSGGWRRCRRRTTSSSCRRRSGRAQVPHRCATACQITPARGRLLGRNQSQQFGVLGATGGQYYDRSVMAMLEDPQWIYQPGGRIGSGLWLNPSLRAATQLRHRFGSHPLLGDGALGQLETPGTTTRKGACSQTSKLRAYRQGWKRWSRRRRRRSPPTRHHVLHHRNAERVACFGGNESGVVSSEQILPERSGGQQLDQLSGSVCPTLAASPRGRCGHATQPSPRHGLRNAPLRRAGVLGRPPRQQLQPLPWSRAFESARTNTPKSIHRIGRYALG